MPTTPTAPPDPRWFQIASLSTLLFYGYGWLEFDITLPRIALLLVTAQVTQYLCTRWWRLPAFEPKSALISSLSLCLLLRTNHDLVAVAAAALAVSSKFLIRWNDKHIFNPTNGALAAVLLAGGGWVSPGQWGNAAVIGFLFACVGSLVVQRSSRSDVTWAFLAIWTMVLFGRSWSVLEPWSIPMHRLASGSLLLFSFFMISDPRTTPDSRVGRILYAALVAGVAWYIQFKLFRPNALLWALSLVAPTVPLIDWLLPGGRFRWDGAHPTLGAPEANPARQPELHPALQR
jgi:Na+-transporting NADH:ubiquinone oxidoreductase subunit NqrB